MEEKVYGTSVLDQAKTDDDASGFENKEYTDEEIEAARREIATDEKVTEIISTDALSGSVVSSPIDKEIENINDIEKDLVDKSIRGKTITSGAIKYVKEAVGVDLTEDDCLRLATFFENKEGSDNDFEDTSLKDVTTALGDEIVKVITTTTDDVTEQSEIARRLISRIYAAYDAETSINDDMRELTDITRRVKMSTNELNNGIELPDNPGELDTKKIETLQDTSEWISRWLEKRKAIDDRNARLKQDYKISDIETKTVAEIHESLVDAINMNTIMEYLNNSAMTSLNKEFRNEKDRNSRINNWITDIKNDPKTLYTFPTNDFNTTDKSREEVADFIYNAFLASIYKVELPDGEFNMEKYYLNNKIATKDEIEKIHTMAYLVLYILAKTFKYKKLEDIRKRRILSYTLDMMSKLTNEEYRSAFLKLAGILYTKIILLE